MNNAHSNTAYPMGLSIPLPLTIVTMIEVKVLSGRLIFVH